MPFRFVILSAVTAAALATSPAGAQSLDPGGLSGLLGSGGGGASGLMGGLLPNVGATSRSNAAGLLSYCVRNKLLGQTSGVTSALGALTGKGQVAQSPGYAAGQSGQLVTGQGQSLSLDGLKGKVKTRVCDMVLQHARTMIGR